MYPPFRAAMASALNIHLAIESESLEGDLPKLCHDLWILQGFSLGMLAGAPVFHSGVPGMPVSEPKTEEFASDLMAFGSYGERISGISDEMMCRQFNWRSILFHCSSLLRSYSLSITGPGRPGQQEANDTPTV